MYNSSFFISGAQGKRIKKEAPAALADGTKRITIPDGIHCDNDAIVAVRAPCGGFAGELHQSLPAKH
jgi:hypothetical protein